MCTGIFEISERLEVTLTNCIMGLIGFLFLILSSSILEGDTFKHVENISFQSWLLILHSGIFVSIGAHMCMFYLYRIYPVNIVFPFYALFPVFGIMLSFIIFYEIPTLITMLGGLIVIVSTFLINKKINIGITINPLVMDYFTVHPPSITRDDPVIIDEESEAR